MTYPTVLRASRRVNPIRSLANYRATYSNTYQLCRVYLISFLRPQMQISSQRSESACSCVCICVWHLFHLCSFGHIKNDFSLVVWRTLGVYQEDVNSIAGLNSLAGTCNLD